MCVYPCDSGFMNPRRKLAEASYFDMGRLKVFFTPQPVDPLQLLLSVFLSSRLVSQSGQLL